MKNVQKGFTLIDIDDRGCDHRYPGCGGDPCFTATTPRRARSLKWYRQLRRSKLAVEECVTDGTCVSGTTISGITPVLTSRLCQLPAAICQLWPLALPA